MLTIYSYKTTDPHLHTLSEIEPDCWVDLIDPLPPEINRISEELGIPIDYLTYPLDLDEQARIEVEENVLFIILRVPYFESETSDVPYITIPLGIVLTKQAIHQYHAGVCSWTDQGLVYRQAPPLCVANSI
jgi:magnesium transporter